MVITNEQTQILNKMIKQTKEDILVLEEYITQLSLDQAPSEEQFRANLTSLEQTALNAIQDSIGTEGNISIKNLVEAYGISRPVFTNLLVKMSNNNYAEVANQGAKGTYIRIIKQGEE